MLLNTALSVILLVMIALFATGIVVLASYILLYRHELKALHAMEDSCEAMIHDLEAQEMIDYARRDAEITRAIYARHP